jgi:type I restriction enzyme R subunit
MKFNEAATIENHVIDFLVKELGYSFIGPGKFGELRGREDAVLVESMLAAAIRDINGVDDEAVVAAVVREVKKADNSRDFLELLRGGVWLKDAATQKTVRYDLIDFVDLKKNQFVVTNQLYFAGEIENIRPDIMLYLNGIPVVDIEAKSPVASTAVSYTEALGQFRRYARVAGKLFVPNAFGVATDGLQTVYGAVGAPDQYFAKWRDDDLLVKYGGDPKNSDSSEGHLEMTLDALLRPVNLLDLIANFIVYEQTENGLVKKIARYQQVRATNRILARVKEGRERKGLIWHTQGSGKTLTMFFTAWKLRQDSSLTNPKVFVLIDRIDLDDQVYEEFVNHGGKNIIRVSSRAQLEKVIASPERGIFISTIQKFSELGDEIKNLDQNIIVLSDEAHRGEEGMSGINVRAAMTNAFFFGFTGTPIDKKTLNTHRNYGPSGERYLDYYSIKAAIEDGATLPVTYEARLSKFGIDEGRVDEQFDELTPGLTDDQKQTLVKKYGKKAALVKLPARMEAIARDIVEHYRLYVEPDGFKAQVVCYDREATAAYKRLFDELLPANASAVVYSPGNPNTDDEELRAFNTSKRDRDEIIKNFKNPNHQLKFVLVCDMLLTGFDAPIEQVMYLDKPLRDHTLLQAVARTNRVYPGKEAGKIIDYYGITRNLYDSLDFDEEIVNEAMVNIERVKETYLSVEDELVKLFNDVNREDPSHENLRFVLRRFIDNEDKQTFFAAKFNRLKSLFEFLAPDPFLKPHARLFEWLCGVYIAFTAEYRNDKDSHLLKDFGAKARQLVRDNVEYEGITKTFRTLRLDDIYSLQQLDHMDEHEQAAALERILKTEISGQIETNPQFQKFSQRLAAIRDEFEKHQIDLSERIKQYKQMMDDMKKASDEAAKSGMSLKDYGLYMLTLELAPDAADDEARAYAVELGRRLTDEVLDKGWQDSSKRDYFIKEIKRAILEVTLKDFRDRLGKFDFPKLQNRLTDQIIKYFR